jgi:hypothetical protein
MDGTRARRIRDRARRAWYAGWRQYRFARHYGFLSGTTTSRRGPELLSKMKNRCLSRFSGRPALPPQSTVGTQIVRESGLNGKDRQRERCHGETVRCASILPVLKLAPSASASNPVLSLASRLFGVVPAAEFISTFGALPEKREKQRFVCRVRMVWSEHRPRRMRTWIT